jgi:cytosine/adenosine deaminase-related metal-dependent hydrolase
MLLGALQFFAGKSDWLGGFGLSPHAPYTASVELYRLARQCGEQNRMPFTTHLAESVEEQEMFLYGRGMLHDFLQGLGRDMSDCGHGSALSHLYDHAVLTDQCLVAHLNYLQSYDWQLIAEQPLHVVHCPRCHQYFQHGRFPLEQLQKLGCTISIGTDSLASNDVLDLRSEIRTARRNYPHITARQWLEMVTVNPAEWIGLPGRLGCIQEGAHADLVAFPSVEHSDPYHTVIQSEGKPTLVMVDGKFLRRAAE